MRDADSTDSIRIQRTILNGILIIFVVILCGLAVMKGIPLIGFLIPIVWLASILISKPAFLFSIILCANLSRLLIPGITETLNVSTILQLLLVGGALLEICIKKPEKRFSYNRGTDVWMILFGVNLLIMLAIRGAGFAMGGSRTYGGSAYVSLITSICFYFAATRIRFTARDLIFLLWLTLIGSLVPMFVQIGTYYAPAVFRGFSQFVGAQTDALLEAAEQDGGIMRWSMFSYVATALIAMAFVFCRDRKIRMVLIVLALIFAGLSGFRSRLIRTGVIIFFSSVYFSKNRLRTVVFWMLAGLVGLGALMIAAPFLSSAMQRSISFIPFIPVDVNIAAEAAKSSTWRFDLWRYYCIPNIPKYLLIGRGVAHDISEFAWLQASWYGSSDFFYYMGRYHSGPLNLLLDYGLLGAVSFTLFYLRTVIDGWKTVRRYSSRQNSLAARYHGFLVIYITYQMFHHYFIFGDVTSGLFELLAVAAQLRILKKTFLMGEAASW